MADLLITGSGWRQNSAGISPSLVTMTNAGRAPMLNVMSGSVSLCSPARIIATSTERFFASARVWDDLMSRPEWAGLLEDYIRYLALQQGAPAGGDAGSRDVRAVPRELKRKLKALLDDYLAGLTPDQRKEIVCYLTVGSANMDCRSQALNGEVMVTIGGLAGLESVLDFMIIAGLCEWPGTPEDVDALLPPPGGFMRRLSSFIKVAL